MSLIHNLSALADGGVSGLQAAQRDWSPFVVHFTSFRAMAPLRAAVHDQLTPIEVREALGLADQESLSIVEEIAESRQLLASSPSQKDEVPRCVCLSECTLPGLIAHAERYGRFGFVFRKRDVFEAGGRPCIYVDNDCYAEIAKAGRGVEASLPTGALFGLANVYSPPGGRKVQDFTHEREWRVFSDVSLASTTPVLLICPTQCGPTVSKLFEDRIPCAPIDVMNELGA